MGADIISHVFTRDILMANHVLCHDLLQAIETCEHLFWTRSLEEIRAGRKRPEQSANFLVTSKKRLRYSDAAVGSLYGFEIRASKDYVQVKHASGQQQISKAITLTCRVLLLKISKCISSHHRQHHGR